MSANKAAEGGPAMTGTRAFFLSIAAIALTVMPATMRHASAEPVADFYNGKQVTLLVGSTPGGGYDTLARVLAAHYGRFIPGHPTVVVQNRPGAGSILLMNELYNAAPKDGTVIAMPQRGVMLANLIRQNGVRFDVSLFNWIGNMAHEVSLVVAWHTAPVKTMDDLLHKELIVGGTGPTSDLELSPRMLNALAGTHFKIVSGYGGNAEVVLAMERGEVQGLANWSWPNLRGKDHALIRDRKINLIAQLGLEPAPDLPDVPVALRYVKGDVPRKAAELFFRLKEISRPVVAGPDIAKDRVAALRKAFMATCADPAFRAAADKAGVSVTQSDSDSVNAYIAKVAVAPPKVADLLASVMNPGK